MINRRLNIGWGTIALVLIMALMLTGCATSYRNVEANTGQTRMVKTGHEYCFRVVEPTASDPDLVFRLVRVDQFQPQKEVEYQKIRKSKAGALDGLVLLPVHIGFAIISLGNVDVYDSVKSEKVVESETKWEIDNSKNNVAKDEKLSGIPIMMSYDYADETIVVDSSTDHNGEVRKDIRNLARSITMDPNADDSVTFKVKASAPYNCGEEITIPQETFIDLYKALIEDGRFHDSFFKRSTSITPS